MKFNGRVIFSPLKYNTLIVNGVNQNKAFEKPNDILFLIFYFENAGGGLINDITHT